MGNTKPIGVAYSDQDLNGSTLTDVTLVNTTLTTPLVLSGATTEAALRITQTGSGNALVVEDSTNPDATPFVVNQNGQLVIGNIVSPFGSSLISMFDPAATTAPPAQDFLKNRAGDIVQSGDGLGNIRYWGFDGVNNRQAANIATTVDGTPVTGTSMPGRVSINTTPDGSITSLERLRVNSAGVVRIYNGSFSRGAPVTKTGNFTLADSENWLICNGAGSITATFPAASSWMGREIMIKTIAAQTVVSASSNVVPLAGGAAGTAILAASAGAWATLVSDGTNWVIMQA